MPESARLEFLRERRPRLSDGEILRHYHTPRWPDDLGIRSTPRPEPVWPIDLKRRVVHRAPWWERCLRAAFWALALGCGAFFWFQVARHFWG